jgi:hypothetical protein
MEVGLEQIRQSPKDSGVLELIVRRPQTGEREVLQEGELNSGTGLVGDNWIARRSSRTPDGSPDPALQLTIMNSRVIALLAGTRERWELAGDQLFIDLDLGEQNVPPGTRFALGSAVFEVTLEPHTGCKKFSHRFGPDAMKFVNSTLGKQMKLRGVNARIVQSGVIRVGDVARKL